MKRVSVRLKEISRLSRGWKHSFDVARRSSDFGMAADAMTEMLKLGYEYERLTGKALDSLEGFPAVIRALRESGV